MTLKDKVQRKRENTIGRGTGIYRNIYDEEDVKEAVLEFEEILKDLRNTPIDSTFTLWEEYKKIFGDFNR